MKHSITQPPAISHMSEEAKRLNPHLTGGIFGTMVDNQIVRSIGDSPRRKERGRIPNKTEQRFLDLCAAKKRRGEITSFRYEGMALKWGVNEKTGSCMTYKPDVAIFTGKKITLIEVKGAHIRDRDIVRFRGCRADWPEFEFQMWQWIDREWRKVM